MSGVLIDAVNAYDVDRVVKLLAAGEDPNESSGEHNNSTPLENAVANLESLSEAEPAGPIDMVVLLLRHGADVNAGADPHMVTVLSTAVKLKHLECVRLLLAAGADPNVRTDEGDSPLRLCAQNRLLEMARILLQCGASKTIDECGAPTGMNALGIAAHRLDLNMVKLLLAHGADLQVRDADRMTPLEQLRHVSVPDDPAAQERFQEIRRLLGGT